MRTPRPNYLDPHLLAILQAQTTLKIYANAGRSLTPIECAKLEAELDAAREGIIRALVAARNAVTFGVPE